LLYAFLLGYLPSIFLTFSAKPIDFYLQDCLLLWAVVFMPQSL